MSKLMTDVFRDLCKVLIFSYGSVNLNCGDFEWCELLHLLAVVVALTQSANLNSALIQADFFGIGLI